MLGIVVLGATVFSYLYFSQQGPKIFTKQAPLEITKPPNFLYAINSEPKHPLNRPMAVIVVQDRIYVSDAGTQQVSVYDYNGKFQDNLKLPAPLKFVIPYGLTYDGKNIYVADTGSGTIYIFDANGKYLRVFPAKKVKLVGPGALNCVEGKLYVSDLRKHQVYCFDLYGNLLQQIGEQGTKLGQLYYPHGIAATQDGTLFVCDSQNNRVQVFNAVGKVVQRGSDLNQQILAPRGVALDKLFNLWVVVGLENRIRIFNPAGVNVLNFGTQGKDYGMLSLPNGIFIDGNQRIYVTELGNSRVSVFSY